jgi:hypothetical protein
MVKTHPSLGFESSYRSAVPLKSAAWPRVHKIHLFVMIVTSLKAARAYFSLQGSRPWPLWVRQGDRGEIPMKKALFALAAASALTIGIAVTPNPAQAGCGWGCGTAIGVGAFLGGAAIGGAIAGAPPPGYYGYAPAPGYVAYSGYYGPQPVGCPGGYWARRPLYDQWGNQMGWSRPRYFCP